MSDLLKKLKESLEKGDKEKAKDFVDRVNEVDKLADKISVDKIKDVVEGIELNNDDYVVEMTAGEKAYLDAMHKEDAFLKLKAEIENQAHKINKLIDEKEEKIKYYDSLIEKNKTELESMKDHLFKTQEEDGEEKEKSDDE